MSMKANYCPICREESVSFRKTNCECKNCKSAFVYIQEWAPAKNNGKKECMCVVCGKTARVNAKKNIFCKHCNTSYFLNVFQVSKKGKKLTKTLRGLGIK